MVTRERALKWAIEAGLIPDDHASGEISSVHHAEIESLVRRAHAEGQREMRERAAEVAGDNYGWVKDEYHDELGAVIRALEVEE